MPIILMKIVRVILLLLSMTSVAVAVESVPILAPSVPDAMAASLLKMVAGLVAVVVLIFFSAWLFKKIGAHVGVSNEALKVISGISMGSKERLVLIKVGEEQLLLGVSPGRIQMLHVLNTPIVVQPLNEHNANKNFSSRLKTQLLQYRVPK